MFPTYLLDTGECVGSFDKIVTLKMGMIRSARAPKDGLELP